jgi:preprotein translocase subunit SecD
MKKILVSIIAVIGLFSLTASASHFEETTSYDHLVEFREQGSDLIPWQTTDLNSERLDNALVELDPYTNLYVVRLVFDEEGTKLLTEITERNLGKSIGIFVEGKPITTPMVQEAITDGEVIITGGFTLEAANQMVVDLGYADGQFVEQVSAWDWLGKVFFLLLGTSFR